MKRVLFTTAAAAGIALAAFIAPMTSADAQQHGPGARGGMQSAPSGGGGGSGRVGMGGGSQFRGSTSGQVQGGQFGNRNQWSGNSQWSGNRNQWSGNRNQWSGNGQWSGRHRFSNRGFYGPSFSFGYAEPYAYGYSPYYYDDSDCYETRRIRRGGVWRYVQVYVCN